MASAAWRSRSSRRVIPPGAAELPRPDSPTQLRANLGLRLADDAGSAAKALSSSPLIVACASAASWHRYGWISREATMTDVRQKSAASGLATPGAAWRRADDLGRMWRAGGIQR